MAYLRYFFLPIALVAFASLSNGQSNDAPVLSSSVESGVLGENSEWSTRWYRIDSGIPGPTVLVVGGIHGNEPAGFRAADQIRHWPIESGKLIVMPRVNRLGLEANMRWVPALRNDKSSRDLNRNFPRKDRLNPNTELATLVWEFVKAQQPDWVFDLHEGFDFHRINSNSVGSSVISFPSNSAFASELVEAVNNHIVSEKRFDLLAGQGPVNGSLARACGEQLDAKSFIIETTFKDQPISKRTHQHRLIVSTALNRIGMLSKDCSDLMCPPLSKEIRVGVFDGAGTSEKQTVDVLDSHGDFLVNHIGPRQMRWTILKQFDVLVFPGGSGSKQGKDLGLEGRKQIQEYTENGGGVVGICAGAYLCSSHYSWSLDLMNASVFNKSFEIPGKGKKSMWYRGKPADIDVELMSNAEPVLGVSGIKSVRYHNGPILSRDDKPGVPHYTVLGYFRGENGIYEQQHGTMVDTPAVVACEFGAGKVIAFSPHFESTQGLEDVLTNAIRFVGQ